MQKIFHDFEGVIRLKHGSSELALDKKQFQEFEPSYKLTGGFTSRYYDGKAHWISNGELQQVATDFSDQDMDRFLVRVEDYQIRLAALTPSPEALRVVEEVVSQEPQNDKWAILSTILSWGDFWTSISVENPNLVEALDQKDEENLYLAISLLKLDKRNLLYVEAALKANGFESEFLTME